MRRFYLLAAAVMMGLAAPRPAAACSCLPSSACQGVLHSSAVFVGRVVRIEDTKPALRPAPAFATDAMYPRRVTFRVAEQFFGQSDAEVIVRTRTGGGDCGYAFVAGTTYLVYAFAMPDGALTTGICSRTQPASWAGGDLKYLRGLTASPPVEARAFGRAMSAGKPFKDARVIAVAGDTLITAVTDAKGKFELHGPPGVYRLKVEVPAGLSVSAPAQVSVFDSRGCGTISVSVQVAKLR